MANAQPTNEQIRFVRRKAFVNSITHLDPAKQSKLKKSYGVQDTRRERNISNFVANVTKGS